MSKTKLLLWVVRWQIIQWQLSFYYFATANLIAKKERMEAQFLSEITAETNP